MCIADRRPLSLCADHPQLPLDQLQCPRPPHSRSGTDGEVAIVLEVHASSTFGRSVGPQVLRSWRVLAHWKKGSTDGVLCYCCEPGPCWPWSNVAQLRLAR